MRFEPQNDYLFVRLEEMPSRGRFTVPMADKSLSLGTVMAGGTDLLDGRGVLFDNRGLTGVWVKNVKHTFIKKDEVISILTLD